MPDRPPAPAEVPSRVVGLEAARARWGAEVDVVVSLLHVGDPGYSDHALEPISAPLPAWLDADRCTRGGRVLRRYGLITSSVLRCYALPLSYLSPVGVLPLVATGQLVESAGPRLYRTAQYVIGTQRPGAMAEGGAGWRVSKHVRLLHERVRRRLWADGWDPALGSPIPQPDLAATALLFGPVTVEGLRTLGARISAAEADDVAHLSRAMAWGQGVVEALQADDHETSMALFERVTALNDAADPNGVALMDALLRVPYTLGRTSLDRAIAPPLHRLYQSLAAVLLGDAAPALGVHSRGRMARLFRGLTPWMPGSEGFAGIQDRTVDWVIARGVQRFGSPDPR